jgi:hypothetical protein
MKWASFLSFENNADGMMRAIVVLIFAVIAVLYSMTFEAEYPEKLVQLYINPWWRFLIVALAASAAMWCPRVGIIVALVAFFYLSDVGALVVPFTGRGSAMV